MSERLAFQKLRVLARIRMLWRRAARGLAEMLPKGLYKRSLLIVIVPMVLLQSAVTFVFMQHHWDLVTRRLSDAVARDIGALTDTLHPRYMNVLIREDGWGHSILYEVTGPATFRLISLGADGRPGTTDDIVLEKRSAAP